MKHDFLSQGSRGLPGVIGEKGDPVCEQFCCPYIIVLLKLYIEANCVSFKYAELLNGRLCYCQAVSNKGLVEKSILFYKFLILCHRAQVKYFLPYLIYE